MVELVDSRNIVVVTKCGDHTKEKCVHAFSEVVQCVMNAVSEFCQSSKPKSFLLGSTEDAEFLSKNNHFAIDEVEEFLSTT